MIKFKNIPNKCHEIFENGKKRLIWESRSVAVNCVVILLDKRKNLFVLASKRGPKAADFQGKLNIVAGYLDWNESGTEAIYRETWEECGLNLPALSKSILSNVINNNILNPWKIKTEPIENKQNISLIYGIVISYNSDELPILSLKYNEIEGEVEKAWWMPIFDIDNYEWAFSHNHVIKDYLNLINK